MVLADGSAAAVAACPLGEFLGGGGAGTVGTAAEWIGRAIAARLHAVAAGRAASMRGWQKRAVRIALIAMAAIVYGETLNEGVRGTGRSIRHRCDDVCHTDAVQR